MLEDFFASSDFISQNYDLIYNNAINKFGMAVLISTEIKYSNVQMDQKGHVIVYDLNDLEITGANIYMQCGSMKENKNCWDKLCRKDFAGIAPGQER